MRRTVGKETLTLSVDDVIMHTRNPKESTKKLLELEEKKNRTIRTNEQVQQDFRIYDQYTKNQMYFYTLARSNLKLK